MSRLPGPPGGNSSAIWTTEGVPQDAFCVDRTGTEHHEMILDPQFGGSEPSALYHHSDGRFIFEWREYWIGHADLKY